MGTFWKLVPINNVAVDFGRCKICIGVGTFVETENEALVEEEASKCEEPSFQTNNQV